MTRRMHGRILGVAVLALTFAHVFMPSRASGTPGAPWLPWDLGIHLLWMVAATLAVLYMTERVWPEAD